MPRAIYRKRRPFLFHAVTGLLLSSLLAVGAWWACGRPASWPSGVLAWLAGVNLTTFAYFGYDKFRARTSGRRVPERVLQGLALVGGSLGAFVGMRCLRHKTLKGRFRVVFWTIVCAQVLLLGWFAIQM